MFRADTPEKVEQDVELQTWVRELIQPKEQHGCGIQVLYVLHVWYLSPYRE